MSECFHIHAVPNTVTNPTSLSPEFSQIFSLIEKDSSEFLTEPLQQGDMEERVQRGLECGGNVRASVNSGWLGECSHNMTMGG